MPVHKVVGSYAANVRLPDWYRGVSDVDIWAAESLPKEKGIDSCVVSQEIMNAFEGSARFASLNDLYTIKVSHLPWPIFFWKHANDALFLKSRGARLNETLYELLKEHWKVEHGTKTQLSLYKSKEAFFDDAVPKEYDHDYLHELVSYPNPPVYTTVLKEGHSVFTDKDKFLVLSFGDKVAMLREEMNVIMAERWALHDRIRAKLTLPQMWRMSVEKTTTALTKGVYSEFIVENLEHFVLFNLEETKHLFKTLKGVLRT
jgi:hypothetical protein